MFKNSENQLRKRTTVVLVTRPQGQAEELETLLRAEGMDVLFQPVIAIGPPADNYTALDEVVSQLKTFQWVVFSSSNGVEA
ncbi:MAG: uroporphyrinogen-III synthase, partial [Planctomycetia bacterium]|nr:uroporphyrinogen-III synthase [Planctomycetia bacterium]